MQYGIYFNQNRCTGCFTCTVACRDWHNIPAGPVSRIRIKTLEKGVFPEVFVAFLPVICYHCQEPACVSACPENAVYKRAEDGIVDVDGEMCLGKDDCALCLDACPYDIPQFGEEENAGMQKCNLCLERWSEGKKPVCVNGCPTRALDAGPLNELKEKYHEINHAEGFERKETFPSIIFNNAC